MKKLFWLAFIIAVLLVVSIIRRPPKQPPQPGEINTPADARKQGLESLARVLRKEGVPLPDDLDRLVSDRKAAAILGKALFHEMSVGSDGIQACATCHFHAGADNRTKNQLSPGLLRVRDERQGEVLGYHGAVEDPDRAFQTGGPNENVQRDDFPFVRDIGSGDNVVRAGETVSSAPGNSNDVMSSMGVFLTDFVGVVPGGRVDEGVPQEDPVFNVGNITVRRVEPRNTPTTINAVFNFTNFWDGRANHRFNGVNPFGPQDVDAKVFMIEDGQVIQETISLNNGSLASQAVGPPLSQFEMSFGNGNDNFRTFPEIGKKLIPRKPLADQAIDRDDSLLGRLRDPSGRGLATTYEALIRQAFVAELWDSDTYCLLSAQGFIHAREHQIGGQIGPAQLVEAGAYDDGVPENAYTLMEANFSLFYGLSVMLYEATLVSDQTPFDLWMDSAGRLTAEFGEDELAGLNVFANKGRCINCHGGPALTNASVRNAQRGENLIEPMLMGDKQPALYDNGFYNISVTPTVEDLGRGGPDPFGRPLAFSRQLAFESLKLQDVPFRIEGEPIRNLICGSDTDAKDCKSGVLGVLDDDDGRFFPVCRDVDGNGLCSVDDELLVKRVTVDGAFKTPGLRNVELTGPYMHNGAFATLREVVEFYDRGGNFCRFNCADLDPDIQPLGLTKKEKTQLVKFLLALTDPRVRRRSAPFDHPELRVPRGHPGDSRSVETNPTIPGQARDDLRVIAAVGAGGGPPIGRFLDADPFSFNPVGGDTKGHGVRCSPNFRSCER